MPCHTIEYPKLTSIESELNTIYNIHDDLKGIYQERNIYAHPKIREVNCTKGQLEIETKKLCEILQNKTKNEILKSNSLTQRWWLNHQIDDFKRMINEVKNGKIQTENYSDYELGLIRQTEFLDSLIEDTFDKIEKRFEKFNEEQNIDWQKNITRHSFVQIMSSFELFSELIYLKMNSNELTDPTLFKDFDKSNNFWKLAYGDSFDTWVSFTDNLELRRYFEKYIHIVDSSSQAKTYFETLELRTEIGKSLVFSINDSINLMRIFRGIKNKILEKI